MEFLQNEIDELRIFDQCVSPTAVAVNASIGQSVAPFCTVSAPSVLRIHITHRIHVTLIPIQACSMLDIFWVWQINCA